MSKIIAPNKSYNGVTAGVKFEKGVGKTSDAYLISWFKAHGFGVEQNADELAFNNMTIEELKAYAEENNIDIGKATSKEGILKKLLKEEG